VDVLREPVVDGRPLGLEGPEEPIPHDQDAAVVAVEVLDIAPVVHPVVRRRVEHPLEGSHPID
jgi:hypothetical protein